MRSSWTAIVLLALLFAARPVTAQRPWLVDLDARDASAGTTTWQDHGTLGAFQRAGDPTVRTVGGVRAVTFDGRHDAYRGPVAPPELSGRAPRTIEVWAFNPSVDSDEETLVAWGRRGGPPDSMLALGWGADPRHGAVTHWADDLGWNGVPRPGRWHLLTYTYDGTTVRVYDDGVEKGRLQAVLRTAPGPLTLAAETGANGGLQFVNEYTGAQQAGSLALAAVRVGSFALSPSEVAADFASEAGRFGAKSTDVEGFLADGVETFPAGPFTLTLARATQTAASLSPRGSAFDFLPGDHLAGRASDGYAQLGDLTLRVRTGGGPWRTFSSTQHREPDVVPRQIPGALAACDLTPVLGVGCPLTVTREWVGAAGHLGLRFVLTNRTARPVEIGALGTPMVFNNILSGRSLEEAHKKCSFADPYIGGPAGYLQVVRLSGQAPALLVLPEPGTSFEAYRPLHDDPTPRSVTFEGFYEWTAHSRAYAENEWRGAQQWNRPTSRVLPPGQTVTYGWQFVLAPGVRAIEPTLMAQKRPVVVGVPGYVLPSDQTGRLFVRSAQPVQNVTVEPAGALRLRPDARPTPHGWRGYTVTGLKTGRCRLTLIYTGGLRQFVHYNVLPPEAVQVRNLGRFHAEKQWYTDPADPFHRTNSFLPWDREHNTLVLQRENSWAVGLSDEMGAGPSVAMAMKNWGQPDAHQISLLETYATHTLWGHVQNPDFSVRASLFYYDPSALPGFRYTVHGGWDQPRSETTWRAYNYPHVTAVYWALYHLARDHQGLVKQQTWQWYLDHAYRTAMAMGQFGRGLDQFGLMVGSVFPELLRDLRREKWTAQADRLEAYMHARERHWASLRFPFGSEMPWDSTGQEEIYTWCRYFGDVGKAQVTLDAITAYMPTVPNWAYNGAARRYFDEAVNNTRWPDIMRITNHYGSGLNSIPPLDAFRRDPADFYLLRIGYAGMDQMLANIDPGGFGSGDFDADPAHLAFDPFTSDYGIGFYGYARNAGTYVLHHPEFGWLAFGGDVRILPGGTIQVTPRDAFRRRVFLAPLRLWLTLDAGTFQSVTFDPRTRRVQITLAPAVPGTAVALLRLNQSAAGDLPDHYAVTPTYPVTRGASRISLSARSTRVFLTPNLDGPKAQAFLRTPSWARPARTGLRIGSWSLGTSAVASHRDAHHSSG